MPTKAERDRAVKLYTETRLPVGEIAAHMGVSRSTVHRWLSAAGIDHRGAMGPREGFVETAGVDDGSEQFATLMAEFGRLRGDHEATRAAVFELARTVSELKGALDFHMKQVQDYVLWNRADVERRDEVLRENRALLEAVLDRLAPEGQRDTQ